MVTVSSAPSGLARTRSRPVGAGWPGLLAFVAVTVAAVALASASVSSSSSYYQELDRPWFAPPSWLFGVVWTPLYGLIALAGWLAWRAGGGARVLVPWVVQLGLNAAWTPVFFGAQRPGWALLVIALLLLAIAWFMAAAWPVSRAAVWCFVPYAAWVAFATLLNSSIAWLNRG